MRRGWRIGGSSRRTIVTVDTNIGPISDVESTELFLDPTMDTGTWYAARELLPTTTMEATGERGY